MYRKLHYAQNYAHTRAHVDIAHLVKTTIVCSFLWLGIQQKAYLLIRILCSFSLFRSTPEDFSLTLARALVKSLLKWKTEQCLLEEVSSLLRSSPSSPLSHCLPLLPFLTVSLFSPPSLSPSSPLPHCLPLLPSLTVSLFSPPSLSPSSPLPHCLPLLPSLTAPLFSPPSLSLSSPLSYCSPLLPSLTASSSPLPHCPLFSLSLTASSSPPSLSVGRDC